MTLLRQGSFCSILLFKLLKFLIQAAGHIPLLCPYKRELFLGKAAKQRLQNAKQRNILSGIVYDL